MAKKKPVAEREEEEEDDLYGEVDAGESASESVVELSESELAELKDAGIDLDLYDEETPPPVGDSAEGVGVEDEPGEPAEEEESVEDVFEEPPAGSVGASEVDVPALRRLLERCLRLLPAPAGPPEADISDEEKEVTRVQNKKSSVVGVKKKEEKGRPPSAGKLPPLQSGTVRHLVWQHVRAGGAVDAAFIKQCRKTVFAGQSEDFAKKRLANVVWRLRRDGYLK